MSLPLPNYVDDDWLTPNDEKSMTDLHLGNAINLDHVEYLVHKKFEQYNIFIPHYQERKWSSLSSIVGCSDVPTIGLLIPTQAMLMSESQRAIIGQKLYKQLTSLLGKVCQKRKLSIPLVQSYERICAKNIYCNELYMYCFRFLIQLVCMVSEASRGGEESRYPGISINNENAIGLFKYGRIQWRIISNNSFCHLYDYSTGRSFVGSFDSVLLIMDTLGQRICMDIGNQVCKIGDVEGHCSRDILNSIILLGDSVLAKYGNDGFDFIAMFEPLLVASLMRKNPDKVTDANEFYNSCRGEIHEMVKEGVFEDEVVSLFDQLSSLLIELTNGMLSNIFCLYRIWGHPRVDIKAGMRKVMDMGTLVKHSPEAMANLILCQFRKQFLIEFFTKNHCYPPCMVVEGEKSYVIECIREDAPISCDNPRYNIHDFMSIQIMRLWELPETYDVCHILNDKAVSPTITELHQSVIEGKGTVMGVQRRGIVRWLTGDSIRCKAFLQKVNDEGLDPDSLIIGMYEKEREIKIKARMFSLMSEQMRMYFVLTEELISNHILNYFPQITMKDALHVQIKKLWSVSGLSHAESLDPTINVDFEKWNLNMRDGLTRPLFHQLDQLFGYDNLITRTHEIFSKSMIYSSSGTYLPQANSTGFDLDPPMCYMGHIGGFEGLRQKGWTLATICLLSYIADSLRVSVKMLGQGDNQVVRIQMPVAYWDNIRLNADQRIEQAKEKLNHFVITMESYFKDAGLPIKTRETWKSTRLFMYGKSMFMDGVALPQWMKKLLRSYALSNEGTLTVSGVIGTIATNLCAAAHASEKPDIIYVIYLILGEWSLEYLFAYHPFTRETIAENTTINFKIPSREQKSHYTTRKINVDRLMATILLIPTAIGGSITIPLTGFIIRGFPDNATEGYSWVKLLASEKSQFQGMFESWYSFLGNDSIEMDMLVQSPWSLNHKKPPTPGLQSRDTVRDWLLSGEFSQNSIIANMPRAFRGFDRKRICDQFKGQEINPLILNELYNSFPQVYLDQVMRRIENTRTIRKLALKMASRIPVIAKLMAIEHEFLGYLYWRGYQKGVIFSKCATEQGRQARNVGWGCLIKGLTTPHPLEFAFDRICSTGVDQCNGSDYIYCRIDKYGKFPPYLGSKAKTKVVSLQDIALRHEPLVTTCAKLFRYAKWLDLGPNAMQVINTNIQVTCDINLFMNVDDSDETSYSGCVEHRFNPACASEGCFINYSPQVGNRVFMSSDDMTKYGRGNLNYTLHFQALYSFIQYNAAYTENTQYQHYHLCCEQCIIPVDDKIDDISSCYSLLEELYTQETVDVLRGTLGFLNRRACAFEDIIKPDPTRFLCVSPTDMDLYCLRRGVHHSLALRCAMMILYTKSENPELIGAEDLQTFPRIYGYKVSSVTIVSIVVEFLFLIKLMRSRALPSTQGLEYTRLKLYYQIMKTPLDRFRGLASLCVGRTWSVDENEDPPFFNFGEFPENSQSFMGSIRSEMINRLRDSEEIKERVEQLHIPSVGLTGKEEMYMLLHRLLKTGFCLQCIDQMWRCFRENATLNDCPQRHIRRANSFIKTVPLPMDSAVKYMAVLPNKMRPELVEGLTRYEESTLMQLRPFKNFSLSNPDKEDILISSEIIKSSYKVLLPTSALYKWDFMAAHLSKYKYDHILIFGDGTGQTSLSFCKRNIQSIVYPTALFETRKFIPQDMMSTQPFISRRYSNVSSLLLEKVPDDILHPQWSEHMADFLLELKGSILIVSDLESASGNMDVLLPLYSLSMKCKNVMDLSYIHKTYFHQSCDLNFDDFMYLNPFCNAHYLEGFVSNICLGGQLVDIERAYSVRSWRDYSKSKGLQSLIRWKEMQFPDAVKLSEKISWNVFSRNYIPLSLKVLRSSKQIIIYRLMEYISGNYKAPYEFRLQDDQRKLLDGLLIRIIKGFKMLLSVLYEEDILNQEDIQFLKIVRSSYQDRAKVVKNLQAVLVRGTEAHHLSKKERRAAQQLRLIYQEMPSSERVRNFPKTIKEIYTHLIVPGCASYNHLRLFKDIL